MNENLKITIAALASIVALFVLMLLLDWIGLDWEKWSAFVFWTAFVFGSTAYLYGKGLMKGRCLLVFAATLALHTAVLSRYLISVSRFPNVFFLFFSPFEAAAVGALLMLAGGPPGRRTHDAKRSSNREEPR